MLELEQTDRRRSVPRTFSRRGSRLSPRQSAAMERRRADWLLFDGLDDGGSVPGPPGAVGSALDGEAAFGRQAPLVAEIGSGNGEAAAALAAARPELNVLAFEVWRPGVASTLLELERHRVTNVRVAAVDAVWAMRHLLGEACLSELWTFFPDPWPKRRHRARRLVTPAFAALAASRLAPGARWRLATDWPDYAAQMREVLDAEPALAGGPCPRWADRPLTRFERRARAAGACVTDLEYVRR